MEPVKPGRERGVFLGVAYGDAWGYPNERKSYADLLAGGPQGPEMPERLIVSDDTQMTMYLADALRSEVDLRKAILDGWLAWLHDPWTSSVGPGLPVRLRHRRQSRQDRFHAR